jgi:DNA-binding MarR family transcriptional regulator
VRAFEIREEQLRLEAHRVKRAELPRTTKLIAEFLGDFANADGTEVRPGVEPLAKMAGVSTRTVKTHLKTLRGTGLIERTKHSRGRWSGTTT